MMGDNPNTILPNSMLEVGMEVSKAFTFLQSEYASKGGTQQYGGYLNVAVPVRKLQELLSL